MTPAPIIAVLGAGYVGAATARSLAAAGADVWAVRRTVRASEAGLTWVAADITAPLTPTLLPERLDGIVLAIAPSAMGDEYQRTYPPAARAALALARRTGAAALVYTSSTGVYGGEDGVLIRESSPRSGAGPGNAALIEAEDQLLDSGVAGITVLRTAGIYGPGRDPRGRFMDTTRLPMHGDYWVNLAHQADIVSAIRQMLAWRGAARALNLSDGNPTLARDIAIWLAEGRGVAPDTLTFGNTAERSRSNQRIDSSALQATGWQPAFPTFREGFTSGL